MIFIVEWLVQYLDVYMSYFKELGYFNDDYKDGYFCCCLKWFKKLFVEVGDKIWCCDGMVDYFVLDVVVLNIVKVVLDVKFIVVVCNYVDLVFFLY